MNNKRFYNFMIVIYPDDPNFLEQSMVLTMDYDSIWIEHTHDLDDDGYLKKRHYHYVVKLKTAKTISAFAKSLNLAENLVEPIKKSFDGALRYLIHFGRDDKYQYDINDVESNNTKLMTRFKKCVVKDITEEEKVEALENAIDSYHSYMKMSILGFNARELGYWDCFRRNMTYFRLILDEHNRKYNYYEKDMI